MSEQVGELSGDAFEEQDAHYERVRDGEGFKSRWALYDVPDLDEPLPFKMKILQHGGFALILPDDYTTIGFGEPMSWLDAWRAADCLLKMAREIHYIYIEDFEEIEDGVFRLVLGS